MEARRKKVYMSSRTRCIHIVNQKLLSTMVLVLLIKYVRK